MWYHWNGDCVTEEGLIADMKAMGELGVGAAHVFAPAMANLPVTARPMTPEWMRLFTVAIREAKKNDIELGFHNCPGWSSSGGPWITPENSMKVVVSSSIDIDPATATGVIRLPQPLKERGFYKDIAVFAFPIGRPVQLAAKPFPIALGIAEPDRTGSFELTYAEEIAPRNFRLKTRDARLCAKLKLEAFADGGWRTVGQAEWGPWTGTKEYRIVPLSQSVRAARYRVTVTSKPVPEWMGKSDAVVVDAEFTDLAFVPDVAEKNSSTTSYGRHAAPHPAERGIEPSSTVDLTSALKADGTLDAAALNCSAGWMRIVRIGCTTTGKGPAPATLRGLECDKLDRRGIDAHWAAMPAKILALPGAKETVRYVIIDSYEAGGQNWTDILPAEYARRRGKPLGAFLLAVCGYVVATEAETYDFLWAWQQTIAELFAENYYDRFTELCHQTGVKSILEPYGGPFDPIRCGKSADIPTGEFWLGGNTCGDSPTKARQIGERYGQNLIAAESFTTEAAEGRWQVTPHELRVAGDQLGWINGINQIVFHSYLHQPFGAVKPGLSLGRHGSQFNRNTTWWPEAKWWGDYVRRGQALLQYGRIGKADDGVPAPRLPNGLRALRREGTQGERIYFIVNTAATRYSGDVGLAAPADSRAELFDAKTGEVSPLPVGDETGAALTSVVLDLPAKGSAFVVFSKGKREVRRMPRGIQAPSLPWSDASTQWTITSFAGPNAPTAPLSLERLTSWSSSADERLRYFAGRAVYEKELVVRTSECGAEIELDLGDVRDVATVTANGRFVACLWEKPYVCRIPLGDADGAQGKLATVRLKVEVVNTWPNRLIGDAIVRAKGAAEPCVKEGPWPEWVIRGAADSGTGIFTWSNWLGGWNAQDRLLPAGLLGPVRMRGCVEQRDRLAAMADAMAERRGAEILSTPNRTPPRGAPVRYVSARSGNDEADGLTPRTAWRTPERLSRESLAKGTWVLFERGCVYRGCVRARSGVTYTAYGAGAKPCIVRSPRNGAEPSMWTRTDAPNVWACDVGHKDVGTLVFDEGAAHAIKVLIRTDRKTGKKTDQRTGRAFDSYRDLAFDLHFWHDYYEKGTGKVYLYSERNPGERFKSIEFNVRGAGVSVGAERGVTVDNICFKYLGAHAVAAGSCKDLTVSNCAFEWIGGSIQMEHGFGRDYPTRFGNAVEVWGSCDGYVVTNCLISQVYDAGVTHQFNVPRNAGAKRYDQRHIRYVDNVIDRCNYSFEFFLRVPKGNASRMEDVLIANNICRKAGYGYCEQRPDRGCSTNVKYWNPADLPHPSTMVICDNAFEPARDDRQ